MASITGFDMIFATSGNAVIAQLEAAILGMSGIFSPRNPYFYGLWEATNLAMISCLKKLVHAKGEIY